MVLTGHFRMTRKFQVIYQTKHQIFTFVMLCLEILVPKYCEDSVKGGKIVKILGGVVGIGKFRSNVLTDRVKICSLLQWKKLFYEIT